MEGVPSSNNYEGGFASELMLKDLGIAVDAAEKVNVNVNLGKLSKTIYENVVKQGLAKKDFSVVYDLIDKKKLWKSRSFNYNYTNSSISFELVSNSNSRKTLFPFIQLFFY